MQKRDFLTALLITGLIALDAYALYYSFLHPWYVSTHYYIYQGKTIHIAQPFSAYYNVAWSLIHNPSDLYATSTSFPIANGEGFRYPPYFLLFILPLLRLPYTTALQVFATFQFLLLPLIAALVWKILSPKSIKEYSLLAAVLFMTLWTPLEGLNVNWYYLSHGISAAYFGQFQDGESKILELCIILGALFFAKRNSMLSGFFLVLSAFDPRFTLIAMPLFVYLLIKNNEYRKALKGACLGIVILILPFLFYYDALGQYLVLRQFNVMTFYAYEWIPFFALLSLTLGYFGQEFFRKRKKKKLEEVPMLSPLHSTLPK